jgi:hypothetical protein
MEEVTKNWLIIQIYFPPYFSEALHVSHKEATLTLPRRLANLDAHRRSININSLFFRTCRRFARHYIKHMRKPEGRLHRRSKREATYHWRHHFGRQPPPPRSSNLYLSNAHVYNSSKHSTHPT